jgi:RNA polymerase sigma-70 factor, ECF subfamily
VDRPVRASPMSLFLQQLETLYRDTAPALLRYFRRQSALAGVAEDLLHDTFIRAMAQADRMRMAVSPRAYLFGIARHVGSDARRRSRVTEEIGEVAAEPVAAGDERLEQMRGAIAALPEAQRETLLLRLQQELSYEEIAEVLQIPVGTVRSRLHLAVQRLHEQLNPTRPQPDHSDEN